MTDVGSQDPRLSALERYRKQLEALLAMVDGEEPPGHDALAGAWQRCQQTFAQYQAHQDALAAAPCPAEVREAIKESMRMNAVAVSELVRHEAELGERKGALRREHAVLEARRSVPAEGRSCDLSG